MKKKKIYTINGKQYQVSDKEIVVNGGYYLLNGIVCQFKDGIFFYETDDGTKWFSPGDSNFPYHAKVFYLEMI